MIKFPKLKSKVILAPMHGITNIAFRYMCKKYGAGLTYTELTSANALACDSKETKQLIKTCNSEKPVAIQLFSENIENLVKSAKAVEKRFSIIDLNLGCPSKKIMEQGSGAALLKQKEKIGIIVKTISSNIKKPLTVKIRSGFGKNVNALEIGNICEKNGASALTIHARTVEQGYSGSADWSLIKKLKENLKIPVIGNGDIKNCLDAKKMLESTGCDYVMVGRAAIGNPFIFKQINEYLKSGKVLKNQTKDEKVKDYLKYIRLCKKFEIFSLSDAKIKAQEFTKGFPKSSKLRMSINNTKSWEEIKKLIENF
jgi:tRNA-dihydrouridine synthase B